MAIKTLAVVPPVMSIDLWCDPRPPVEQVILYKFYERIGTNWLLLRAAPTNLISLSNTLVTIPHTYAISASNAYGESAFSAPYVAPSDPKTPTGLRIIQMKMIVPINSTIEGSTDLISWMSKLKFRSLNQTNIEIRFLLRPDNPVYFFKEAAPPIMLLPAPILR